MTLDQFLKRYEYNTREDRLGEGGFGTVYKAYDTVLDRYVAIKISQVKQQGDKVFSVRNEFLVVKSIPLHPNLANYEDVFTFDHSNGVFDYAILQYYPDGNLCSIVNSDLSFEERASIAKDILKGIAFLHAHKVLHRDIKPANILIQRRRQKGVNSIVPKITDFGLSKLATVDSKSRIDHSFTGGTLLYSSPEQLQDKEIRFNADLWSWAALSYIAAYESLIS